MNSLIICLNAIFPIFFIIAAGYAAKRAGILRETEVPRMNAVAFKVFMPAMCLYNVYHSELSAALRPKLFVFTFLGILLVFGAALLFAVKCVKDRSRRSVVAQGLYRSNYLIVGVPFVSGLVGEGNLGAAAVMGALVAPMFNVLAVILLESYNGTKTNKKKLLLNIAKNPLILGSFAGLVLLLLGVTLPSPLEIAIRDMSRTASPLLLFLLGAFFHFGDARQHWRELAAVTLGRLVVIPAVMLTLAVALGFRGSDLATLVAVFASSTAVASFTMAEQMGGDAKLAGNIVVMTSACASFTLFAWSLVLKLLALI
ncbi:MAG: AEC family transporter [Oscillospiraceae bacterium]|nr:AEC family transporter [Oscillospiraceae bacterium]